MNARNEYLESFVARETAVTNLEQKQDEWLEAAKVRMRGTDLSAEIASLKMQIEVLTAAAEKAREELENSKEIFVEVNAQLGYKMEARLATRKTVAYKSIVTDLVATEIIPASTVDNNTNIVETYKVIVKAIK